MPEFLEALAFALSIGSLVSLLVGSVLDGKRMRLILFLIFLGNILLAVSYLLQGSGINAAASCFLGGGQAIVNYGFQSKGKPIPRWLLLCYMLSFVVLNVWLSKGITLPCALVLAGSFTFIMCIAQSSGIRFRLWSMSNALIYLVYDLVVASYSAVVTHVVLFLFALIGLLFTDLKVQNRWSRGETHKNE